MYTYQYIEINKSQDEAMNDNTPQHHLNFSFSPTNKLKQW